MNSINPDTVDTELLRNFKDKLPLSAADPASVTPADESDDGSDLADLTLYQLTERVRASHAATQTACATALQKAMDAGDGLIEGESRNLPIPWKEWVTADYNCRIKLRTAYLYVQLAKARPRLEAAIRDKPELSIRGAAKLIAVKRKGAPQPQAQLGNSPGTTDALPAPPEVGKIRKASDGEGDQGHDLGGQIDEPRTELGPLDVVTAWDSWSRKDRQEFLSNVTLLGVLAALPKGWRPTLEERASEHLSASRLVDLLERRLEHDGIGASALLQKIRKLIDRPKVVDLKVTRATDAA